MTIDPATLVALHSDADAFASLTEPYRRQLHVHCYRVLDSFEEAEDMVQETMLRAWRSRLSFEGRSLLRTWLYTSGIFYSIQTFTKGHGAWVRDVLEYNPGAIYPELVRHALLSHQSRMTPHAWTAAVGWAVAAFVIGLVYFWHGEEKYGRG